MGKRIYKKKLIDEINQKIQMCEIYQEQDPDIMAIQRVSMLSKNPCADGKYYVNVLLKKPGVLHTYTNPAEIIEKSSYNGSFLINEKYKDLLTPFNGCIIELNVEQNTFKIEQKSDYFSLMTALFNKGVGNLFRFKPSKDLFKNNFFKADIEYAKTNNLKTIYYSIGNFGIQNSDETNITKKITTKFLTDYKQIIENKLDIGDFDSNSESEIKIYSSYIEKLPTCNIFEPIPSSFEKRLKTVSGLENLSLYTLFNEREQAKKNGNLISPKIYDFALFVKNIYYDITKSNAFEVKYNKPEIKSKYDVQYELYKNNLSSAELIPDGTPYDKITKIAKQFKLFKQIYNKNSEFKKSVDSNKIYKDNMLAYEKSEMLIKLYKNLKISYNTTSSLDSIGAEINVIGKCNDEIKDKAIKWVKENIIGFKGICLKINDISSPYLNESITIKVPVFYTEAEVSIFEELTKKEFFSNDDNYYETVSVNIKWKNGTTDMISNGASFNINGQSYNYYDSIVGTDELEQIYNDKTGENEDFFENTIENVFTNDYSFDEDSPQCYFKKDDLLNRLITPSIKYTCYYYPFTPAEKERFFNVVIQENADKKIMFAETQEYANDAKDEVEFIYEILNGDDEIYSENEWVIPEINDENKNIYFNGEPVKVYIDTINYDEWEVEINKLKKLRSEFNSLPAPEKDEKTGEEYWNLGSKSDDSENPDKPKLCDKVWPLDFFGVIGMLGLNDLSAKFGLKNNLKMYVYNEKGEKTTFKEINEKIGNRSFNEILNSSEYKQGGSLLNQFSNLDYDDFKKKFADINKIDDKKKKEEALQEFYTKDVKVGLANGYYFYPTGLSLSFRYSMMNPAFKLDGTTQEQTALLEEVTKKYKEAGYKSYVEKLAKTMYGNAATLNSIPLNVKIFFAYPFLPSVESLLGGEGPDSPDDYSGINDCFYIPDSESVKSFSKNIIKTEESLIKFDIYCKEPMICKYPKSKDPKCQSGENEGFCGLEECLKKEREIKSPIGFDLDKFLTEHENKIKELNLKKAVEEYNNNLKTILDKSKNSIVNFGNAVTSKNEALDTLYEAGKAINPIMRLLPVKCLTNAANDGKNAICSASRKAKDKTILEDEDSSFTQTLETVSILTKEAGEAYAKHFKETFKDMSNAAASMGDAFDKLIDGASNIYNWCPRRFGDFIADSGIGKGLKDSLTAVMKTNIADIFKGILGSCIADGIIDEITSSVQGLTGQAKNEFKQILQSGDYTAIEKFGKTYPQVIDKFGNGEGGLDITKLMNSSSFNMNIFTAIQEEMLKRMNPAAMLQSAVTSFMEPSNLIDFAQKGVTSMLSPSKSMGSTIMNSIEDKGLQSVEGQIGTQIDTLINTSNPGENGSQLANGQGMIESIRTYHDQKVKLYEAIKLA